MSFDPSALGLTKVADAALHIGITVFHLNRLCRQHGIPRTLSKKKGGAAYLAPETFQRICAAIPKGALSKLHAHKSDEYTTLNELTEKHAISHWHHKLIRATDASVIRRQSLQNHTLFHRADVIAWEQARHEAKEACKAKASQPKEPKAKKARRKRVPPEGYSCLQPVLQSMGAGWRVRKAIEKTSHDVIRRIRFNARTLYHVQDVIQWREAELAKPKEIIQPVYTPPTEATPPKPGPFDAAIKAHQKAVLASTPRYHSEEAEKAFRRRAIPLTPAQEIKRWRAEYKAAVKRRHDPNVCRVVEAAQEAKPQRKPLNQRPQAGWLNQSA